ncbi:hypothetical protein PVAP13_4KG165300 [Panicum virgatum]|uniref:Uncharacterized protein n=1 Tax=Panicum virgatum TaxID=38727 RepID=A0A8T0TT96_PANVG|nr:hypothetical protein PVAP13_4KG165300 [Panicum virgatum]
MCCGALSFNLGTSLACQVLVLFANFCPLHLAERQECQQTHAFGLIRLLIVVSLLVLVSSLTAGGWRPHCSSTDPNNPCPQSCSPHSSSCH